MTRERVRTLALFSPKIASEGLNLLLVRTHRLVVKIDAWAWNVNCNKRVVREATSAVSRGPTYWPTHVQKDRHHSFVPPCVSRVYLRFIVIRVHSPFALFRAPVSGRLACQWMDHKCMRVRADRIRETIHFRLDDRNEFGKMRGGTVLDLIDDSLKLRRRFENTRVIMLSILFFFRYWSSLKRNDKFPVLHLKGIWKILRYLL